MTVMNWIVDFISTIIEVLSLMFFCGFFVDRDKLRKKLRLIVVCSVAMACIVLIEHQFVMFSKLSILHWIAIAIIFMLIFRKRIILSMVLAGCIITLSSALDFIMCYLVAFIFDVAMPSVLDENSIYRILVIIFSKALTLSLVLLLYLMLDKTLNIPVQYLLLLGSAIFLVFFAVNISIFETIDLKSGEFNIFPILFYLISILFLIAIFYFIIKIVHYYEERKKYAVINSRNEMLENSLQETKRTFEQWRRSIHDYKNTIHALYTLANAGNMEELKAYLEKENETLKQQVFYTHTGNSFVDAIVYAKSNLAKEKGIPFRVIGMLPESCPVSGIHLATILGNLIDNALEASAGEANPFVELKFKVCGSMLLLYVSNAFTPELKLEGTAKAKKEYHGIGLSSVKALIRQYHGALEVEQINGVVTASVLFSCSNTEKNFNEA